MDLKIRARTAACAAALLIAAGTLAARAQDAAPEPQAETPAASEAAAAAAPVRNPTDVVAKIGDETITEADVTLARKEFGSELEQVPEEEQRSVVIDALVNLELLAKAARDAGMDQGPEFEQRLEFLKLQTLRNAYVEKNVMGALAPEELQAAYQSLVVAQHKPEEQVHARHILVETKEAADKIIADLKGGASFEELAKQSKDPSGENGGDLGFFGKGQMVPPFEAAAFALEPGKVTETPVQSEFGWHVIKVEEKKMSEPPALADVEDELRNHVLRQKFEAVMTELRNKYPVEVIGAPATAAAPEEPATEGGAVGEAPAAEPEAAAPN